MVLCASVSVDATGGAADSVGVNVGAGSKPNIVFILADDLGWGNIGVHNGVTRSPHIDALFTRGMKLNHSYSHKVNFRTCELYLCLLSFIVRYCFCETETEYRICFYLHFRPCAHWIIFLLCCQPATPERLSKGTCSR